MGLEEPVAYGLWTVHLAWVNDTAKWLNRPGHPQCQTRTQVAQQWCEKLKGTLGGHDWVSEMGSFLWGGAHALIAICHICGIVLHAGLGFRLFCMFPLEDELWVNKNLLVFLSLLWGGGTFWTWLCSLQLGCLSNASFGVLCISEPDLCSSTTQAPTRCR